MSSLQYKNITVKFDDKTVINNFSFNFVGNNFYILMGESGCGKTTLLRVGAGLLKPTTGEVILFDKHKSKPIIIKKPNSEIFMMNQGYINFPWKTSLQNVLFPLKIKGYSTKQFKEIGIEYLEKVGLSDCINKLPGEMSGGQRQRLALARVMISKPSILLMDEPLSALDDFNRLKMQNMLKQYQTETKSLIIMITHNNKEAEFLSTQSVIHFKKET